MQNKSVGQKLINLREGKGLSREQLAEELKVTCQRVCDWEDGKAEIDKESGAQICAYYGISMDELFGEYVPARRRRLVENRALPVVLLLVVAVVCAAFGIVLLSIGGSSSAVEAEFNPVVGAVFFIVIAVFSAAAAIFMLIKRK